MKRWLMICLGLVLTGSIGCNRAPKQELPEDSNLDHVSQGPRLEPKRIAHAVSKLEKFQKYAFEVPPHVITPKLQGQFSSFMQGAGGARISNESADVELLVMTEDQFDAFTNHRSAESVYAIEPSHDHEVSITLPTTQDAPAKYYAVFRRANDGKTPIWINTDLSIDFGSF